MAQQHGQIALYVDATHRFLFDGFAHFAPEYSEPAKEDEDRLGQVALIEPAGTPYNQRWAVRGTLRFLRPRFMLRHAQMKSGGAWVTDTQSDNSTVLVNWLYSHCITARQNFVVFVAAHGQKQGAVEYNRPRYYTGKVSGAAGDKSLDELLGDLMLTDGSTLPRWIALNFVLTDEGTYSDFDSLSGTTTRGTRPV